MLQIFRSVVDDPVARAAPAPADIIRSPELHRRNTLKRNGDVDQQPYSRLEPVGLLGAQLAGIGARLARARMGRESG
jgi:hypothetical protein